MKFRSSFLFEPMIIITVLDQNMKDNRVANKRAKKDMTGFDEGKNYIIELRYDLSKKHKWGSGRESCD